MKTKIQRHLSANYFLALIVFLNLVLVILSIASYASLMSSIVYWTQHVGSIDYSFLTNVNIWSIDYEQKLFTSFDITSYFLLATVAIDVFAIAAGSVWKFEEDYTTTRRFGVLNAFIACIALVSYYGIMTILAMKASDDIVYYQFPGNIMISPGVGPPLSGNFFDPTPWILFALLASTLIMILRQTVGLKIEISLGKRKDD